MPKSKIIFFVEFSCVGKHLHTKFQKMLLNGLNFDAFLHFLSILTVFWPKKPVKCQFLFLNFLLLRSIHILIFRKFHEMVWILLIVSVFSQFLVFFVQKRPKNAKIEKKLFCWIFFYWEAFAYQISENFIKRFGFCKFSSFLVFWLFVDR